MDKFLVVQKVHLHSKSEISHDGIAPHVVVGSTNSNGVKVFLHTTFMQELVLKISYFVPNPPRCKHLDKNNFQRLKEYY